MSSFANLFSGVNFRNTIQQYANQNGWKIADINEKRAVIKFSMNSGRSQTIFIIRYESTLEFSVPSGFGFSTDNEIPDRLSTILLQRNSQKRFGFWCMEQIGGKQVYSYMHNAEQQLIDSNYFSQIVRALLSECDEFEGLLLQMLS